MTPAEVAVLIPIAWCIPGVVIVTPLLFVRVAARVQLWRELRTFTVPEEWRQEAAASPDLGAQRVKDDPWLGDQPLCQCVACAARRLADQ